MNTHQLDARRLLCPLPVIRTQNMVKNLPIGAKLQVLCTDPGALHDIGAWCRINGHHFLGSTCVDGVFSLNLEVGTGGTHDRIHD
jgi:tRNA 2-thiouridine synthesizing protein A